MFRHFLRRFGNFFFGILWSFLEGICRIEVFSSILEIAVCYVCENILMQMDSYPTLTWYVLQEKMISVICDPYVSLYAVVVVTRFCQSWYRCSHSLHLSEDVVRYIGAGERYVYRRNPGWTLIT